MIIALLGLSQSTGLLHTALHAHAICPLTGKVYHVHGEEEGGRGDCHGSDSPAHSDDECQVFAVFFQSAAPTAPQALLVPGDPAPDLSPCRAPPLAPVVRTFALWLLSPSLSPPGASA